MVRRPYYQKPNESISTPKHTCPRNSRGKILYSITNKEKQNRNFIKGSHDKNDTLIIKSRSLQPFAIPQYANQKYSTWAQE
jgi:hypothetical protein